MKHTQGEWYVSDIPQEDGCYIYTNNNRFSAIARVYKGNNTHAAEAEANARLMAASKDILEALERLLKEARQNSFNANGSLSDTPAEAAAMAAINKATGKDIKLFTPPNYSIEQE